MSRGFFPPQFCKVYTVSPLYMNEPSSCKHASGSSKEPEPVPSTSGMSEIAACPLTPLLILQLYHLPPPLPPSVSNSCCLFTQFQPLCVSCCTVLLSFSRYCTVTLKMFCLKMKSVPPPVLPSSGKSTTIFFRTQEESLRTPLIPPFPSLFMYN